MIKEHVQFAHPKEQAVDAEEHNCSHNNHGELMHLHKQSRRKIRKTERIAHNSSQIPLLITVAIAIIPTSLVFSSIGLGAEIYQENSKPNGMGDSAQKVLIVWLVFMYLLEIHLWNSGGKKKFCLFICLGGVVAVAANVAQDFPLVPVVMFTWLLPIYLWWVRTKLFPYVRKDCFLKQLATALWVTGVLLFAIWKKNVEVPYTVEQYSAIAEIIGCADFDVCPRATITWGLPLVQALNAVCLGFVSHFIGASVSTKAMLDKKAFMGISRLIVGLMLGGCYLAWVAASMVASAVSSWVIQGSVAFFVESAMVFLLVSENGKYKQFQTTWEYIEMLPVTKKVQRNFPWNWVRAMGGCLMWPGFLFFLVGSVLHAQVRLVRLNLLKLCTDDGGRKNTHRWICELHLSTPIARWMLKKINTWSPERILPRMLVLSILYLVYNIGIGHFWKVHLYNECCLLRDKALWSTCSRLTYLGVTVVPLPRIYQFGAFAVMRAASIDGHSDVLAVTISCLLGMAGQMGYFLFEYMIFKLASKKMWLLHFLKVNTRAGRALNYVLSAKGCDKAKITLYMAMPELGYMYAGLFHIGIAQVAFSQTASMIIPILFTIGGVLSTPRLNTPTWSALVVILAYTIKGVSLLVSMNFLYNTTARYFALC